MTSSPRIAGRYAQSIERLTRYRYFLAPRIPPCGERMRGNVRGERELARWNVLLARPDGIARRTTQQRPRRGTAHPTDSHRMRPVLDRRANFDRLTVGVSNARPGNQGSGSSGYGTTSSTRPGLCSRRRAAVASARRTLYSAMTTHFCYGVSNAIPRIDNSQCAI